MKFFELELLPAHPRRVDDERDFDDLVFFFWEFNLRLAFIIVQAAPQQALGTWASHPIAALDERKVALFFFFFFFVASSQSTVVAQGVRVEACQM